MKNNGIELSILDNNMKNKDGKTLEEVIDLNIKQSKLESLIESSVNTFSGWFISFLLWSFIVGPLFDIDTSIIENMLITAIFTVVSIGRSYFWRRFFANGIHIVIVKWVKKYYDRNNQS